VLLIIVFAFWKANNHFFWMDDWSYLQIAAYEPFDIFKEYIPGDIKPLYKLFFSLEARLFGVNASFYHYCNLFIFSGLCYAFYRLIRLITHHHITSFAAAILLAVHPVSFHCILWSFSACEFLHLLAQVVFVGCLLIYIRSLQVKYMYLAALFLIVQHLFFANGSFMALLGLVGAYLFIDDKKRRKSAYILFSILLAVLPLSMFLMMNTVTGAIRTSPSEMLHHIPGLLKAFFTFIATCLTRATVIHESLAGDPTKWIVLGGIFSFICYIFYLYKDIRKKIVFLLCWLLVCSAIIPIARYRAETGLIEIPYYYPPLIMVPGYLLIITCIDRIKVNSVYFPPRRTLLAGVTILCLAGFFMIDQYLVSIFEYRNIRNKASMEEALRTGEDYLPFDDHMITMGFMHDAQNATSQHIAREVYSYWLGHTVFQIKNSYEKK
jgi:hypothetical protein